MAPIAKLKSIEAQTTSEIIAEALKLPDGTWFRGSGAYPKNLWPSLYRHPDATSTEEFELLERRCIDWFKERSIPHVDRHPINDWETLFLMQHYGFPTRLLDFSESPMAAAFFAVEGGIRGNTDAVIWALKPDAWNKAALGRTLLAPIPSISSTDLSGHLPITSDNGTGRIQQQYPVAMRGIHNSRRIVVQQGVFVIFGSSPEPMELAFKEARFPADCLCKITIPYSKLNSVEIELKRLGYSASSMYPGLDTLAGLAKKELGY